MVKIGIVLNNLYVNQLAYDVLSQEHENYDISIFYEENTPVLIPPKGAIYLLHEIFSYDGLLIATNLDHASLISKCVKSFTKVFYVWDLEWIRNKKDFISNINIYRNNNLILVTPSEDYRRELKNYCNRDSVVLPLDFKAIYGYIKNNRYV